MMERRYKHITDNINRINEQINEAVLKYSRTPEDVTLMAITKTRTVEEVNVAIESGIKLIGENKVQELVLRQDGYKNSPPIHFVGHLQSNKAKQLINRVSMIHSVDSFKLGNVINNLSLQNDKIMDVLIEVNIGGEGSKHGVDKTQVIPLVEELSTLKNIRIKGLMTIPPIAEDYMTEKYFYEMRQLFVDISYKKMDNIIMDTLSMGMSDDFHLAIKHGSNIVRIGTAIFGSRY